MYCLLFVCLQIISHTSFFDYTKSLLVWVDARDNCETKDHCEDDGDCPDAESCWTQTPCDFYATEPPTTAPPTRRPTDEPTPPRPTRSPTMR